MANRLAKEDVEPLAMEIDRSTAYRVSLNSVAELGFCVTLFPRRYGGVEAGYLALTVALEEVLKYAEQRGKRVTWRKSAVK